MSKKSNNTNNATVKSSNVANSEKSSSLDTLQIINLDKHLSRIQESGISKGGTRISIYKYPEKDNKGRQFAGNSDVINGLSGKSFRDKRRKELSRFADRSLLLFSQKDEKGLKELKSEFVKHYEEFYTLNDFSLHSLTQKADAKVENVKAMLQIFSAIK